VPTNDDAEEKCGVAICDAVIVSMMVMTGNVRSQAAQAPAPTTILFQNVVIFDGKSGTLSPPSNVLVRGNKIERISTSPIPVDRSGMTKDY
jgi:hypothetical protein